MAASIHYGIALAESKLEKEVKMAGKAPETVIVAMK